MLRKGLLVALGIVMLSGLFGFLSSFATHLDRVSQQPSPLQAAHAQRAGVVAGAFFPIVPVDGSSPTPQWSPLTGDGSN